MLLLTTRFPGLAAIAAAAFLAATALTANAELSVTRGSQTSATTATVSTSSMHDWRYTLRPGETLPQVSQRLLSSGYDAIQLAHYNGIDDPNNSIPGQSISIPVNWLDKRPEPAMALAVSGPVHYVDGASGRRQALTPHTMLHAGDEIVTQTGFTVIQLADGSLVRLGRDSHLIFNRLTRFGKTGMVDTRMRLDRGELDADVEVLIEDGSRFEVDTPSAVAAVRGTAFRLQVRPSVTELQVTEGTVAFGPAGRTVNIPAGFSGTTGQGTQSPVDIRRLPTAPQPSNPLPETAHQLPQELSWPEIAGADRYQVDIFNADTGQWLSREQTTQPALAFNHLDNGRYDIRLAAVDARGMPGMPYKQTFDVAQQAKTATLEKPAADAKLDDEMPSFSWSYNGNNEVARVEIARSSDFSDLIATSEWAPDSNAIPTRPLNPGQYYWRVVTEAGGTSIATSEPRKLMINGTLPPARIINVNYVDSQVRIFWQRIEAADKYQLQLSEDPSFNNIIKEADVADTTAALRLIPGRRYFVRLKALSDGPIAGRWGPGRELFVN
ncbi:hypothetical protein RE428_18410 [Marinobacter nanhaiticus D15-8W]|uniref:Peptidoglycan-binding protein LysM n=1 Tax=Marinobacter nanhaiticus D15-8W TaxID=626887 RepID=N6WQX1_9GAMM|nr:FecR domain-containing protein [Marinobacter nanhaiticus]ENO13457.2 peptidoglycan-binding protein LysM [Marinobacter nanhaiticus D15-8W]BES70823.1 hypothetical protein RE428_18410 [Marinobacter nanhaiticus D15-8W]